MAGRVALRGGIAVAAMLLLFGAGLWTVSRMTPTVHPPAESASEPVEEFTAGELLLTVEPRRVPPGTRSVRLSADCASPPAETVAQSGAFAGSPAFTRDPSGTTTHADAALDPALAPGRYHVFARCGTRFGSAELEIAAGDGPPESAARERVATTRITLAPARTGEWRDHPAGEHTTAEPDPGQAFVRVGLVHEMRVPVDDPDVAALRAGAAGYNAAAFLESRLGTFDVETSQSLLDLEYSAPVVRAEPGSGEAVITYTGLYYGTASTVTEAYAGIAYTPPWPAAEPPLNAHEIVASATGWTVAGVSGPPPLAQDAHLLRLNGGRPARMAFIRDGRNASVAGYLGEDRMLAAFLEGGEFEDPPGAEDDTEPVTLWNLGDPDTFVGRAWTASLVTAMAAAVLIFLHALARALGGAWWRRRRNWPLAALGVGGGAVYLFATESGLLEFTVWTLVAGVSGLALFSTCRAARGHSDLPVAVAAVFAALAGLVLAAWPLASAFGPWPATGVLAVAAAVTAAVPRLRGGLTRTGLTLLGAGGMLAAMAVVAGFGPPHLMWVALLALGWLATVFGWSSEASHRWTVPGAARWLLVTSVVFGVPVYALTYLDDRSTWASMAWDEVFSVAMTVVYLGLPLLALMMLVVRMRRFGQDHEGLTEPAAFHTAVFLLLFARLQATGLAVGVLMLLVWAGVFVLLPAPRAELLRPVPADEHRLLVRDMIKRRSARTALTALLRQPGEGDDFEQRRQALERAGDERDGTLDSDLALSTLAGRTPWQNGLASFWVGLGLSLPFSAVRIVESVRAGQTGVPELAAAALAVVSLPLLCMVFGYFYPRVRGTHPVAKCLSLFVTALLVELPTYMLTLLVASSGGVVPSTLGEPLAGVLVAVGNTAVVSIGLGLWWEWRLMWLAGEPWGRVRNVRTLRALAAPLAAVSIAVATTAATALVNNVIAPLPGGTAAETTPSPTRSP
ncbi:hypothetical protein FXF51_03610 [Nonomuraea sp. PA05]|uniref:hypothetical protein n=1 Tax=Nonomuraea sp. PA05 TaxID=2604466 RepID=UPI0011D68D81|nr:hypothetical protein [Nonomuraea sp. PA05]TYB70170.1 hypothetical protein FXF51_03610 [Nonomuraea sp. PA05]